jgi:release factor glutamine methyltransferase
LELATLQIAAAGCATPSLDAEVLLADVLGATREQLLMDPDLEVRGPRAGAFAAVVCRRAAHREPVAYITGRRHFRRLELEVDPRVLIPRAESELLVEVGLTLPAGASVLDVGTGSGAVALALKDERPDLSITGSDVSAAALEVARANGRRLGLAVRWAHADLLDGVPEDFETVLCNPPYVAEGMRGALAPEIVRHEPPQALFAGADGLAVLGRLLRQLSARKRTRVVALEVGAGQAPQVCEQARAAGFCSVRAERDLAGVERVLIGERARSSGCA